MAIRRCFVDTSSRFGVLVMFLSGGFVTGTPSRFFLLSTGSPREQLPLLQRYYEGAMTSRRSSLRTSLPSLGGSSVALEGFAPAALQCPAAGQDLVTRWSQPGCRRRANDGISHVPEQPPCA